MRYDIFGNLTARETGLDKTETSQHGHPGLHFTGRQYAGNRLLAGSGFLYDANGNLVEEPVHEAVGGYRYDFSPENRLDLVRDRTSGKVYQESRYGPEGDRWARVIYADSGHGLLTLRDATGQVAAEYVERNDALGPSLSKQYVHGNGKLIAVHSDCGPAPELKLVEVTATTVVLEKVDHLPATWGYWVFVETDGGAVSSWSESSGLPDQFGVDLSAFSATADNYVRIQTHGACGLTGHSNAISIDLEPSPLACVTAAALSNMDFEAGGGDPYATLQP